jgi:hypothetical protein
MKTTPDFCGWNFPKLCLGEMSVLKIGFGLEWFSVMEIGSGLGWFSRIGILSGILVLVFEDSSDQSLGSDVDRLFTVVLKIIPLIVAGYLVPMTMILPLITPNLPTPYTRMGLPSDLARTGEVAQGGVEFTAATVADRTASKGGLPLPGDSPRQRGNTIRIQGREQPATSMAESLPSRRAF